MTTIAILDGSARLIGLRRLPEEEEEELPSGAVEVDDGCDLPTDGTYKWMTDEACFMPVGHGLGKPGPAPISTEQVVLLLAAEMDNPPQEVLDWMEWYRGLSET